VVVALGTNFVVFVHLFAVDDLFAVVALHPEPFGYLDFLGGGLGSIAFRSFFFKPSHDSP
jgi:hypothetical protein